ncbi:MAG: S9 family peptidase [Chitinophagales bacterium]
MTKKLPLEDFFRNPEQTGFKISPDGRHISWLAPVNNRLNIHLQERTTGNMVQLTAQEDRDVFSYFWLNNEQIAFLKDNNGDENHHLWVADLDGTPPHDLTPFDNSQVQIIDELEDRPDEVLIALNKRDPVLFDVYILHTKTGALDLIEENPGNITGWETDHDGNIRIAISTDGVNTGLLYREKQGDAFTAILETNFKEGVTPLFFDFENTFFYALSNVGRNTVAIVLFDPKTAEEQEVLFEHPEVDIDNLGYSRKRKVITAAVYTTWKREMHFFDPVSKDRYEKLRALITENAEIYITDKDKEEKYFIVRTLSDRSLGNYYLYDAENNAIQHLANVSPWLQEEVLCSMQPIEYTSRDGLQIHGYLTVPKDVPPADLPLIVNPHGGPWVRDTWRFDPEVQFLANRGFAVLQMNYRGSSGYGKKFWEAGFKQWGKKMQDDITDGVEYLIQQGIADRNRIGIYGGSYGGYAVLAGLTFTPALYACGVDYVGVSNLFTFMETIPPYWKPYLDMMYEMVGHPEKDKELLASSTPLFHIDNITAPLFVAQGAMDPRVKKSESDQIVHALRAKGVDVEYMVKDNEGHGFANEENRFAFYTAMEKFFEKHLNK